MHFAQLAPLSRGDHDRSRRGTRMTSGTHRPPARTQPPRTPPRNTRAVGRVDPTEVCARWVRPGRPWPWPAGRAEGVR